MGWDGEGGVTDAMRLVPVTLPPGDEELVREVLFDAVVTAPMEAYWTALALNISEYVRDGRRLQESRWYIQMHRSCLIESGPSERYTPPPQGHRSVVEWG